ncbi:MAG: ribosome maturation factor RimM [Chloroflexota bacterium]
MTGNRKSRLSKDSAGSPQRGEPAFLVVGKLRHPHGLRGEMLMDVITDFPERLKAGLEVYAGEEHRPLHIRSTRPHGQGMLIAFDAFDTPEGVGTLRNLYLYVPTGSRPPLPEGEYYHHQLLGLAVVTDEGQALGELIEIMTTPANDVYVVRRESGADVLLPAIEPVVLAVDLEKGEMRVHLLPGLIE